MGKESTTKSTKDTKKEDDELCPLLLLSSDEGIVAGCDIPVRIQAFVLFVSFVVFKVLKQRVQQVWNAGRTD